VIRDQRPETRDQRKQKILRHQGITQRSTTRQQQNAYFNYLPGESNDKTETRDQRPETRD